MTACIDLGVTGHCKWGRHHRCAYRPGGPCHGGIGLAGGGRYSCPCECHRVAVGQLELFEATV